MFKRNLEGRKDFSRVHRRCYTVQENCFFKRNKKLKVEFIHDECHSFATVTARKVTKFLYCIT